MTVPPACLEGPARDLLFFRTPSLLLALPKEVFDTFEEVSAAGWAVD
jgi:hypothetical protein